MDGGKFGSKWDLSIPLTSIVGNGTYKDESLSGPNCLLTTGKATFNYFQYSAVHVTDSWSCTTGSYSSLLTLKTAFPIHIKFLNHNASLFYSLNLGSLFIVPAGRGGASRLSVGSRTASNKVSTLRIIPFSASASVSEAIGLTLIPKRINPHLCTRKPTTNNQRRPKKHEENKRNKKNVFVHGIIYLAHRSALSFVFDHRLVASAPRSLIKRCDIPFDSSEETFTFIHILVFKEIQRGTLPLPSMFLYSPPSFLKFRCAMNIPKATNMSPPPHDVAPLSNPNQPDVESSKIDLSTSAPPQRPVHDDVSKINVPDPATHARPDVQSPITVPVPVVKNDNQLPTPHEQLKGVQQPDEPRPISLTPRHDNPVGLDTGEEISPSDDLSTVDDDEDGVVLDPENEGDAELLKKKASGASDLTGELIQLRSHRSSESSPNGQSDHHSSSSKPNNIPRDMSSNTHHANPSAPPNPEDKPVTEEEIVKRESVKMKELLAESDAFQKAFDNAIPSPNVSTPDSSGSYEPLSTSDEGGRAGLDPNHSEQWVPSVIYPGDNLSKSKKRRRRQKKKEELLKQNDSLGKLLSGKQSKEDEEQISTLDPGNSSNISNNLNESGIIGGNLFQNKRKRVQQCRDKNSFSATLNSTKFGDDFDDESTEDDHSILREGSPDIDLEQEDIVEEKEDDVDDMEEENLKSPEADRTNANDSLSSNSTGAKRRRKRTKKPKTKPATTEDLPPHPESTGSKMEGRETRSKALVKHGVGAEVDASKNVNDHENKGEKEKRSTTTGATNQPVVLFKTPAPATRSDIQRVVSRAIHKSKLRISNNFAIQSKIQNFRIITNEKDVKKIPDIDELAPLVEVRIPEFIWPQEEKTQEGLVYVKTRGAIQFVILSRDCLLDREIWDTPKIEQVRDFASFLICKIAELKLEFGGILRWTNPWGNAVVMGLDSSNLDMLLKFRTFLATLRYGNLLFNTCPKDAMTNNFSLSILLRSDLREFREEFLAESLFARNNLFGALETLQSETFTAADTTRAGVSKNGWRNVTLEGDETFMASLSKFTALHWFNIGPASVQIHGGDRRAETMEEIEAKLKRRRFNLPAGQGLTSNAQAAINASFREDHQVLVQAKKQAVPASSSQSAAQRGTLNKNKKKK